MAMLRSTPSLGQQVAVVVPAPFWCLVEEQPWHESRRSRRPSGSRMKEGLCWSGHRCVPFLSLSSHSIYLSSADIDAVLTIVTNHPQRCTLCLASCCSSLAASLCGNPPSPPARTNPHQLACYARRPQRR